MPVLERTITPKALANSSPGLFQLWVYEHTSTDVTLKALANVTPNVLKLFQSLISYLKSDPRVETTFCWN